MKPSLLTPALQEKIVHALRLGMSKEAACDAAGIGRNTFFEWQSRGRRYQSALEGEDQPGVDDLARRMWRKADALWNVGKRQDAYAMLARLDSQMDRSAEVKYYELVLAVDGAVATVKQALLSVVAKCAADGDWKAAMALLKSRWPEEFSERRHVVVEVVDHDAQVAQARREALELLDTAKRRSANGQ